MELLWRFLLGGAMVSLFAMIGDVVWPKRFAGLFSAAPSVALATLALTISTSGAATAALEARSMIAGSAGFIAYALASERLLATGRLPALSVAAGSLLVWGTVTWVAWLVTGLLT